MNWYKHYIGDFNRDTGHLTLVEAGAYRALIDHYYATGEPLPLALESLYRIVRAHSATERAAVRSVLAFFAEYNGRYHHRRIDAELAKARLQAQANAVVARHREEARRKARLVHDSCSIRSTKTAPNQIPDTREHQKRFPRREVSP